MTYVPRSPLGFKNLLSWKQAGEILSLTKTFVASLPKIHPTTRQPLTRLRDHMIDSARSIQRNIEEGYKRATTAEYIKFLGFSRGSLEELIGDFKDCQRDGIGNQRVITKIIPLLHGEDKLLGRQIEALEKKMANDKTGTGADRWAQRQRESQGNQRAFEKMLRENKLKRLPDGRIVPDDSP